LGNWTISDLKIGRIGIISELEVGDMALADDGGV
jgi:hypothetical protein